MICLLFGVLTHMKGVLLQIFLKNIYFQKYFNECLNGFY